MPTNKKKNSSSQKLIQFIKKSVNEEVNSQIDKKMKAYLKPVLESVKKYTKTIVENKVEEQIEKKMMQVLLENSNLFSSQNQNNGLSNVFGEVKSNGNSTSAPNPSHTKQHKKQKIKELAGNDPIWESVYSDIEPGEDEPMSPEDIVGSKEEAIAQYSMGAMPESLPPSKPIQQNQNPAVQAQQYAQQNMGALNPQQAGGVQYNQAPSAAPSEGGQEFVPGKQNQMQPQASGMDPTLGISPSSVQRSAPVDVKSEIEKMKEETKRHLKEKGEI